MAFFSVNRHEPGSRRHRQRFIDVYVKDRHTGDIALASTSDTGDQGQRRQQQPSLSANGTRVAFHSFATNLDPADTDGIVDVYVKDLMTGDIDLASTSDTGTKGNDSSVGLPVGRRDQGGVPLRRHQPGPGRHGRHQDIYVKDLTTGDISLASTSDTGIKGNDSSFSLPLGRWDQGRIPLRRHQLDPADTDFGRDIYVKELGVGTASTMFRRRRQRRGWPHRLQENDPDAPRPPTNRRAPNPPPAAQCSDGIDNDNDGLTDFPNDPGCSSTADNSEGNKTLTQCSDRVDNDGDGLTEFPERSWLLLGQRRHRGGIPGHCFGRRRQRRGWA